MNSKYDPHAKYPRHPRSHPSGGVFLTESAAKVQEVGLSILKSMGVKIKEGGVFDLLRISRPAAISYHKTYLECVGGDFYNTKYLNKAASTSDPLERMKNVVCFFLSGIGRNSAEFQNNGPLNPILGETYIAHKKDGTGMFCEQISHHPPVSAYLIIGPGRSYKLYGTGELDVKMNGFNNIIGRRIGKTTIEFADGTKIVFTNPDTRIDGLLLGDRRYNYIKTCVFLDKKNHLSAEISFLYEETGTISKLATGIKKLFVSQQAKPTSDQFEVVFFNYTKLHDGSMKKNVLCEGTGSWLSHIQIDNQLYWLVNEEDEPWIEEGDVRLPSDSLFRQDSKYIKLKDFDNAQREKEGAENRQRADERLRKEHKKETA